MMRLLRSRVLPTALFIAGAFALAVAAAVFYGMLRGESIAARDRTWSVTGQDDRRAGSAGDDGSLADQVEGPPVQIRIRSPEAAPGLSNDSAGPLFIETNMAPGDTSTRCVSVTNVGVQLADVRMFGVVTDHGLADHLGFIVEASNDPSIGCDAFAGKEIFRGSLARLADRHGDYGTGITLSQRVYPQESVSFRMTQWLEGTSPQGVTAQARFGWEARGAGAPSPLRAGRDPLSYQARSPGNIAPDPGDGHGVARMILDAAITIAKRGWSWVILLLLVIAFLVVQDRIDRRDPRLAGARVHPEPDLYFPDDPTRRQPTREVTEATR